MFVIQGTCFSNGYRSKLVSVIESMTRTRHCSMGLVNKHYVTHTLNTVKHAHFSSDIGVFDTQAMLKNIYIYDDVNI